MPLCLETDCNQFNTKAEEAEESLLATETDNLMINAAKKTPQVCLSSRQVPLLTPPLSNFKKIKPFKTKSFGAILKVVKQFVKEEKKVVKQHGKQLNYNLKVESERLVAVILNPKFQFPEFFERICTNIGKFKKLPLLKSPSSTRQDFALPHLGQPNNLFNEEDLLRLLL